MYFIVMVKNLPISLLKVPRHGPALRLRVMTTILKKFALTPKQKNDRLF